MRRTTFLFASFLLFLAGTMVAHAQSELVGKSWYIQNAERVKNGVHRYMSAVGQPINDDALPLKLTMTEEPTPFEEFVVIEGSNDKIKLYNPITNTYIGHIPTEDYTAIPLAEESNAAEYTATKQSDGSWSLVDEQTTGDHNALHGMGDGDNVVRWLASEPPSHWTFTLYNTPELTRIEAGKYYQIFATRTAIPNRFISSQSIQTNTKGVLEAGGNNEGTRRIHRTDGTVTLPTLWSFEVGTDENGETYYLIRNANTGHCLGQMQGNNNDTQDYTVVEMPLEDTWAGHYTLAYNTRNNFWFLKDGDYWINALGGSSDRTTIGDWSSNVADDSGNRWTIQPVTEIPVTVYSDTQWASLTLPFAAELPEGLTAYYASKAEGDVLTLTAIDGQQIPAHTPVLLAPDTPIDADQTYQLTILYGTEVPALTAENKLEGTTAARTGFGESEVYVLASDGTTGVLKKNGTVNTIPCNKSYIPASAFAPTTAAAPAYVQMQIGQGEATGIEGVQTAAPQAEEVYYDLHGRRVLYPAHGVFVTKSGQKVFIR